MGIWTYSILENFCMFNFLSKENSILIDLETKKKIIKKNNGFISPDKRPSWCKKTNKKLVPSIKCFRNECPFYAYAEAEKKCYKILGKGMKK